VDLKLRGAGGRCLLACAVDSHPARPVNAAGCFAASEPMARKHRSASGGRLPAARRSWTAGCRPIGGAGAVRCWGCSRWVTWWPGSHTAAAGA